MIYRNADAKPVQMLPGLIRRTLVEGASMMVVEFTFDANTQVPNHTHPHEQVGYVVSGRARMTIDGQDFDIGPGDSYHIPSNVPHSALTLTPAVMVDTFSPPREDYR
jgi:unsaturated pyranuronate lyase